MSKLVHLTGNMPNDRAQAIAEIVMQWGRLEHVLALTIKRTSGMTIAEALKRARALNSIDRLTDEVRSHFSVHAQNQDREGALTELLSDVLALAKLRNDVVHGLWCFDDAGAPLWIRTPVRYEVGAESLVWIANHIGDLTAKINALTRPDLVMWEVETCDVMGSPASVERIEYQVSAAASISSPRGPTHSED